PGPHERLDEPVPDRRPAIDGDVAGDAQLLGTLLDVGTLLRIDAAGIGKDRMHPPAALGEPGNAEAGVEAAGEGEDDVFAGHGGVLVPELPLPLAGEGLG